MFRSTIVLVTTLALVACSGADSSGVPDEAPAAAAPETKSGSVVPPRGDGGSDASSNVDATRVDAAKPQPVPEPKTETPACKAEWLLGGSYTGVCLSDCFDFGFDCLGMDQGDCSDIQTCVPCVNDGKPTGAPGCPK
jgi:hypothetical protein